MLSSVFLEEFCAIPWILLKFFEFVFRNLSRAPCTQHTTPEKFENDVFTLKTHQMFAVRTSPAKF